MKLFKYDNWKITISEEALCIRAFSVLWNRDKSKDKIKAISEFGFIYFFCDPRSDYQFLTDEEERFETIRKQEGLPDDWDYRNDELLMEAMKIYEQLTTTASSQILKDLKETVVILRNQIKGIDYSSIDEDKKASTIKNVASTLRELNKVAMEIADTEKKVIQEIAESGKMRGSGEKTILEDSINI